MLAAQDRIVKDERRKCSTHAKLNLHLAARKDRSQDKYSDTRQDQKTFTDKSFLDLTDSDQHGDVVKAVGKNLHQESQTKMESSNAIKLRRIVLSHVSIFRTDLSSGSPT